LCEEDIGGSGFAVTGSTVHPGLGGDGHRNASAKGLRRGAGHSYECLRTETKQIESARHPNRSSLHMGFYIFYRKCCIGYNASM